MPHEIDRILQVVSTGLWFIEPQKAEQIMGMLALRAAGAPRDWTDDQTRKAESMHARPAANGPIYVLSMHGAIVPRGNMMANMSGALSLDQFSEAFAKVAADGNASAIVLDIDSPGGMVDLVPETAAQIFEARRNGRPIVAVANTTAASAAYWLASAADELVVTPSGQVGSIGVYTTHDDISKKLSLEGISRTFVSAGPRKVENSPFGPLSDEARAAIQAEVEATYGMFVSDVARFRGVSQSVVTADPESGVAHYGGGRMYHAAQAVQLGMADRVGSLAETLARLSGGASSRNPAMARRRLGMI